MFENITSSAKASSISTGITGFFVAGGIFIGIWKKKGFWTTFGYGLGLGIVGIALSSAITPVITKN